MFVLDFTDGRDDGAGIVRIRLCPKRVWCYLEDGHDGPCEEVPRVESNERPDWDKRTRDPIGWAERKRHR